MALGKNLFERKVLFQMLNKTYIKEKKTSNDTTYNTLSHIKTKIFYNPKVAPYIFVSPFLIAFVVFYVYPVISTINMSFQKVISINNARYIGFDNYTRLNNVHFFNALRTNCLFTILTLAIYMVLPMALAVILNSKKLPFRNGFRSMIFVPALVCIIVSGVAFRLLFGELDNSPINRLLILLGFESRAWMSTYPNSIILMVLLATWRFTGLYMVYYLSGMQSIPEELYESAEIDGANTILQFFKITLPGIRPIMTYVLTIAVFEGFRLFGESIVFWTHSMPADLGLTLVRYIYQQAFQQNDMGFGSAIGMVLLFIVLAINIIQMSVRGFFKKEDN